MLKVENLSTSLGGVPILTDLSITVAEGSMSVLLGPNGVGKSTLYRCIIGALPYEGHIQIDGRPIADWDARRLAQTIAYVPQEHTPSFSFLVRDVVLMGRNPHRGGVFGPGAADMQAVMAALDSLGLTSLAQRSYLTLSGGQRQLVLIARALAQGARLLLLDEPTASLDFGNQMMVWQTVRRLVDEGRGALVCTHDPNHALWFGDNAIALEPGGRSSTGPAQDIINAARVDHLYSFASELGEVGGRTVVVPKVADRRPARAEMHVEHGVRHGPRTGAG